MVKSQVYSTASLLDFFLSSFNRWIPLTIGQFQRPSQIMEFPAKYSLSMFKNKPSIAQVGLLFNDDGSVTFTDRDYGKPVPWRLSSELDGKDVAWSIFDDVYLDHLATMH